jgi:hypothetical protein
MLYKFYKIVDKIKDFFDLVNVFIPKYVYIITGSLLFFYFFCFHYVNVHEVGIRRNVINGNLSIDKSPGMYVSAPWIQVSKIDTRPQRICIECDCKNMTCVLVTFNPKGWQDFVQKEGFRYYWWSNRFSFNSSHKNEYRGIKDILKGYAFDGIEYSFLKIEKNI